MCGRFTLTLEASELQLEFGLDDILGEWQPRYNIAPSQSLAVITNRQKPKIELMRWGLIPAWAKDHKIGSRLINARAETVSEKPAFRRAFERRRCLILADGFYEWNRPPNKGGLSIPYYFYLRDRHPFTFAGLWELWRAPEGSELTSCTIITCPANDYISPIHRRMPVMLNKHTCWSWLEEKSHSALLSLLVPYPAELMEGCQVSRIVNNPAQDLPDCILPTAATVED